MAGLLISSKYFQILAPYAPVCVATWNNQVENVLFQGKL